MIVLSVGPNEPPEVTPTFLSVFDISLLFARRAGQFVVQAAGNKGPGEASVVSFSPWTMGVAASTTGRSYNPTLIMGDGRQLHGVGLAGTFSYKQNRRLVFINYIHHHNILVRMHPMHG